MQTVILSAVAARSAERSAILVTLVDYGSSRMTSLRRGALVRSATLTGAEDDWTVAAVLLPRDAILTARADQRWTLLLILGLTVAALLIAEALARYWTAALAGIDATLKGLPAINGGWPERLDTVNEIQTLSHAATGSLVAARRERSLLNEYENRLHWLEKHAPFVVCVFGLPPKHQDDIRYLSQSVERLLGVSRDQVVTAGSWIDLVDPEDRPAVLAARRNLAGGGSATTEYRIRHADGSRRWFHETLTVTEDGGQAVCVLIEISKRKAAEQRLVQSAKLASLGEIATGMAHELTQPLNIIQFATRTLGETIKRGDLNPENARERVTRIAEQVKRASALIGHLRVFGRIPSEPAAAFPVRAAVDGALSLIGQQLRIAGIVCAIEERDPHLQVVGHQTLLEQVVLNLIINARDAIVASNGGAGPTGGRIGITLARVDNRAELAVEDDGGGIPEGDLKLVFDPFFTSKPPDVGTGLGLSISAGIVKDMGGAIAIANTESGVRVALRIPLSPTRPSPDAHLPDLVTTTSTPEKHA